jgi:hypothetical protein
MSKTNVTRGQHHLNKADPLYQLDNVPSIPGDPSAELAKVEAEVDRVAGVLAGLLGRVNFLKAQINVSKSPFLRVMPSEIIAEIFTLCLDIPGPEEEPGDVDNTVPLKLGAVCNAFRTIAWSTPQLWATVVLDIKSSWKITTQAALLSDWLLRSGHLPLSIWLNSSEEVHWTFAQPELILKVINVFSNRWKCVDIRLPSSCYRYLPSLDESLPMLESLTLKPPGGQGDRHHRAEISTAPNLRRITLQCLYLSSIRFEWHLLTSLDLESFYIDESLAIFRQALNLVHLNVRRILGGDDGHALPNEPIVMPSLSSLTFVNDKATDLALMLGKMTLPALRKLSFSADGNSYAPCSSLIGVIQRSSCPLESLSLKHCSVIDFKLLLAHLPLVKELFLEMDGTSYGSRSDITPLTDDILQSLIGRGKDSILPRLEKLGYTGLVGFTWPKMMQMVESRTMGTWESISNEQTDCADSVSTGPLPVRLREVSLCLTIPSEKEASALTPLEPPFAQDTGLKWTLEIVR